MKKKEVNVVPDPEVPEKAARRSYTAEYKRRILREAEACVVLTGRCFLRCITPIRLLSIACAILTEFTPFTLFSKSKEKQCKKQRIASQLASSRNSLSSV